MRGQRHCESRAPGFNYGKRNEERPIQALLVSGQLRVYLALAVTGQTRRHCVGRYKSMEKRFKFVLKNPQRYVTHILFNDRGDGPNHPTVLWASGDRASNLRCLLAVPEGREIIMVMKITHVRVPLIHFHTIARQHVTSWVNEKVLGSGPAR